MLRDIGVDKIEVSNGAGEETHRTLRALRNVQNTEKYEFIPPRVVGNKRRFIISSAMSGRTNATQIEEFILKYGED